MKYFKNAELARLYNVSEKSVRNWIINSRSGKFDLELYYEGEKTYIADTLKNEALLEDFTVRAKKYRNSNSLKNLYPNPDLYELYSPDQILNLILSLDTYREIPQQYRYRGAGAVYWTSYLHKLHESTKANILTTGDELLKSQLPYLQMLLSKYSHVNVIDVGVGNGLAARGLLAHFAATNKLRKYVGIDISPELLSITRHNVEAWFENTIPVETHVRDIGTEKIQDVIARVGLSDEAGTANVVLLLGGIYINFRDVRQMLSMLKDSLGKNDLLIASTKLDTLQTRRFFDFSTDPTKGTALAPYMRFVPDLLHITPDMYEVEQTYDEKLKARHISIKLLVAISVHFTLDGHSKSVHLEKGERILLWRGWHKSLGENTRLFEESGFQVLQTTMTEGAGVSLVVANVGANPKN